MAENKYKNLALNIGVIVIALIAANFIYGKFTLQVRMLNEKKELEQKKNIVFTDISQLENKVKSYQKAITATDSSSVINAINALAKDSGVKIESVKPGQEKKEQEFIRLPVDLNVKVENYHALGKFISKLENYQDILVVEHVDFRGQERASAEKKELSVNLRIIAISSGQDK